jgi:ABC-type multidrug transport system fused ATPase/permease subunit
MIDTYRKLFDLLNARERRRFGVLLGLVILSGLADMAGVATILPFLALMTDPGLAQTNPALAWAYAALGFGSDRAFLIFAGGVVFSVIVLGLGFKLMTIYGLARFSHMRNHSISNRLIDAQVRQPYVWFLSRNTADLGKTVLHEVDRVIVEGMMPAIRLIAHTVSLVLLIGLLLVIEPMIALAAGAVLATAYLGIFVTVRRALTRLGRVRTEMNAARYRIAGETMSGIKEIKVRGMESAFTDRYGAASLRLAATASASQAIGELPRNVLEAIAFGGMVVLVLALLLSGTGNLIDIVPTLGVFAFAGLKMFPNLQQVYFALTLLRFIKPMIDNVHREVLATRDTAVPPRRDLPEGRLNLTRALRLASVGYAYPGAARPALSGIDIDIPARASVGIVGGSGAGKSTLVDVMLGLLSPTEGRISVDGQTVDAASLPLWQRTVGYVPQSIYLSDDSVAANIAFGIRPEAIDRVAVERAARIANLHDFVMTELPDGYDTAVGERGVRLSGGQRQRIGIARALYHDPDILILDEATSALDNLTEKAVMEALQNIGQDKTVVMVAHRLSTVMGCDRIFMLENGRVIASGSYRDLVTANEAFRRMALA